MINALLYIRVSTDEQADKGYSQRDQDERLRRYCDLNCIEIRKVIFEDHSAKTFNRPEWKKLLLELKKQKGKYTDVVLFTKWDRFSRNTSDAYQMIGILKDMDIEAQAIEQPLAALKPHVPGRCLSHPWLRGYGIAGDCLFIGLSGRLYRTQSGQAVNE